jgi:tRNA(Arg) A34 adenosine deaminase TadA
MLQCFFPFHLPFVIHALSSILYIPLTLFPKKINYLTPSFYLEVQTNKWMDMACEEAKNSVNCKGGPFGAVIVQIDDQSEEVLRYWRNHNHVTLWNDPTAHAEVTTIRSACQALGVFDLGCIKKDETKLPQPGETSHCEIYSSAEPCPMCFAAICWAGIPALYFAATRYDAAQQGVNFSDEAIYDELNRHYKDRSMKIYQCTTANSLDAFNLWKRSKKIPY